MTVMITYVNEDGDTIHISSGKELVDAFGQFVDTKPPVLHVKVKVVQKTKAAQRSKHQNRLQIKLVLLLLCKEILTIQIHLETKESDTKEKLKDLMQNAQEIVLKRKWGDKDYLASSASTGSTKSVAAVIREKVSNIMEKAQNIVLKNIVAKSASLQSKNESEAPFLHGRHMCDECLCTPIIEAQYHATN
eukprot:15367123-Ditylum_brightwellii.AAC.3